MEDPTIVAGAAVAVLLVLVLALKVRRKRSGRSIDRGICTFRSNAGQSSPPAHPIHHPYDVRMQTRPRAARAATCRCRC